MITISLLPHGRRRSVLSVTRSWYLTSDESIEEIRGCASIPVVLRHHLLVNRRGGNEQRMCMALVTSPRECRARNRAIASTSDQKGMEREREREYSIRHILTQITHCLLSSPIRLPFILYLFLLYCPSCVPCVLMMLASACPACILLSQLTKKKRPRLLVCTGSRHSGLVFFVAGTSSLPPLPLILFNTVWKE
jgi:hypothetical protein